MTRSEQLLRLRSPHSPGIAHDRLLVKIARLYHEKGMSQSEIASTLRLSRQKVQRLLRQSHEEGIVRVIIEPIMGIHDEAERALEERFGLREALVVETTAYDDQTMVAREVGVGAAEYLMRVVRPGDSIVVSWGGTILGMVNALGRHARRTTKGISVIQGLGTVSDPSQDTHSADLARRMARVLGGQTILLPAPGVAGSKRARDSFYQDPNVASALDAARGAAIAVMGIGAPRQDSILVREGSIVEWHELQELKDKGAVGDINLRYFDEAGVRIASDLDRRIIGLTLDDLRRVPHVVGVAGGAAKLKAIRGALAGRLVHVLITDHVTAEKLLTA